MPWPKGKPLPDEVRDKISASRKDTWEAQKFWHDAPFATIERLQNFLRHELFPGTTDEDAARAGIEMRNILRNGES